MNRSAVVYALLSAVLFGLSTPAAKVLLGSVHPAVLAGLLYCGAGLGIALLRHFLPRVISRAPETSLARADLPWLAGAITFRRHHRSAALDDRSGMDRGFDRVAPADARKCRDRRSRLVRVSLRISIGALRYGMVCLVAGAAMLSWTELQALDSPGWSTRHYCCLPGLGPRQ